MKMIFIKHLTTFNATYIHTYKYKYFFIKNITKNKVYLKMEKKINKSLDELK